MPGAMALARSRWVTGPRLPRRNPVAPPLRPASWICLTCRDCGNGSLTAGCHRLPTPAEASPASLKVAFDLRRRARLSVIGILAELTVRPALAQQIPALVQSGLHRTQPLTLLRAGQLALGDLVAKLVFLADEVGYVREDLRIVHDLTVIAGAAAPIELSYG